MTFADRLRTAIAASGPLCVGIDPAAATLAAWGLADDARGARELGMRTLDACRGRVGIVKPQVAFFERFGARGFAALEEVLAAARAEGLVAIADAKRGDIGSTAHGYAEAWLAPGSPLEADAVTASPYLGTGALDPLVDLAARHGKGVFMLVATSNPDGRMLQGARNQDGRTVAAAVLAAVREHAGSDATTGAVGAVIGGTVRIRELGIDPDELDGLPVLGPGFGAQGARLSEVRTLYGPAIAVPSVSRSVLGGGPDRVAAAIDEARAELPGIPS